MAAQAGDLVDADANSDTCLAEGFSYSQGSLESIRDTTDYKLLADYFLVHGRGRKPSILSLIGQPVTKKSLLQLFCLKQDGSASWEMVTSWFHTLFPSAKDVTRGCLEYRVNCLLANLDESIASLNTVTDFGNTLPDCLTQIGTTRDVLLSVTINVVDFFENVEITNEIINSLETFRIKEKLPQSYVSKCLKKNLKELSDKQIRTRILKSLNKIKDLKKKQRHDELKVFLADKMITNINPNNNKEKIASTSDCSTLQKQVDSLKVNVNSLERENNDLKDVVASFVEENNRLKVFEDSPRTIKKLEKDLDNEKKARKKSSALLSDLKNTKVYKRNCNLRKYIKFQSQERLRERKEFKGVVSSLKNDIEELRKKIEDKDKEIQNLKKQLKSEQTVKARLKKKYFRTKSEFNDYLKLDEEETEMKLRGDKCNQFSNNVRMVCMALMGEANVAAQNCSLVIQIVSKYLFKKSFRLSQLPSASTVLNIASEASHIAHHHVIEKINEQEHFTFATDGTSREKKHYLERHIILDNKISMSLGYCEVESDNAQTLLEKTIEILDDLSEIYVSTSEQNKDEIFKSVITKMKCVMSDRAAVMKSFGKKLLDYKENLLGEEECVTQFLYCNAHFLLGLVKSTESASSKIEQNLGKLGRDLNSSFSRFANDEQTAAFRVIRLTSDILGPRGDEKSGCREEWLAFCSSIGKSSKFTSFRSNRFNNLFENAFAIMYHFEDIKMFLTESVSHSNLKLQSVLHDLNDYRLISIIAAIAFFFKFFTNPYWQLMNSNVPYGHFPAYVKQMKVFLSQWQCEISFSCLNYVFQNNVNDYQCDVENVLHNFTASDKCDQNLLKLTFTEILKAAELVLQRQLAEFLEGGIYGDDIDPNTKKLLDSSPLTNLVGERIFGDFDFDLYRRRHASLFLRSTLNMLKRNKTTCWLGKLGRSKVNELLFRARKNASTLKNKSRVREEYVRQKVKERIQENKRQKREKELKKMKEKNTILEAIISQGGVVSTKEDLDRLVTSPKALENIRLQLKYRKLVLLEPVNFGGNLTTLYFRFCEHLGFETSSLPKKIQSSIN